MAVMPYGSGYNVAGVGAQLYAWLMAQQAVEIESPLGGLPPPCVLLPAVPPWSPTAIEEQAYTLQLIERRGLYTLYQLLQLTVAAIAGEAVPGVPTPCGALSLGIQSCTTAYGLPCVPPPGLASNFIDIQLPSSITVSAGGLIGSLCSNVLQMDFTAAGILTVKLPYQRADSRENPVEYAIGWYAAPTGSSTFDSADAWRYFEDAAPLEQWASHYEAVTVNPVPRRYP